VNFALSCVIDGYGNPSDKLFGFNKTSVGITILSFTCSIVRSELALLLGPLTLYLLVMRQTMIDRAFLAGLTGGGGGAILSLLIDSFFWGRWTWPEMEAVIFNVVEGKSEEWGVSLLCFQLLRLRSLINSALIWFHERVSGLSLVFLFPGPFA
jgi:hypothetical protein